MTSFRTGLVTRILCAGCPCTSCCSSCPPSCSRTSAWSCSSTLLQPARDKDNDVNRMAAIGQNFIGLIPCGCPRGCCLEQIEGVVGFWKLSFHHVQAKGRPRLFAPIISCMVRRMIQTHHLRRLAGSKNPRIRRRRCRLPSDFVLSVSRSQSFGLGPPVGATIMTRFVSQTVTI